VSDYRVIAHRSNKIVRQKFYVTIVGANGEPLFHSEMLRDKSYAVELGQKVAVKLGGDFINAT
jgi:hypothetical protein